MLFNLFFVYWGINADFAPFDGIVGEKILLVYIQDCIEHMEIGEWEMQFILLAEVMKALFRRLL